MTNAVVRAARHWPLAVFLVLGLAVAAVPRLLLALAAALAIEQAIVESGG